MSKYEIDATRNTPYILFKPAQNHLLLSGECWPENARDIFDPLLERLQAFLGQGIRELTVDIQLDYHNTSSQRMIRELIFLLQTSQAAGHAIRLNLYYIEGDTDMMEDWEELMDDVELNYHILERND